MTFAIVVLVCVAASALCAMLAWRLDTSPGRSVWRRMWPEVFSGELAVASAWCTESDTADETPEFAAETLNYVRG